VWILAERLSVFPDRPGAVEICLNETKTRALERIFKKGFASEGQIVNTNDRMPGLQEPIGEMTSNKVGCPVRE
jgi:hypothetical protein